MFLRSFSDFALPCSFCASLSIDSLPRDANSECSIVRSVVRLSPDARKSRPKFLYLRASWTRRVLDNPAFAIMYRVCLCMIFSSWFLSFVCFEKRVKHIALKFLSCIWSDLHRPSKILHALLWRQGSQLVLWGAFKIVLFVFGNWYEPIQGPSSMYFTGY